MTPPATREQLRQPVTAIRACAQLAMMKLSSAGERGGVDLVPYLTTIVAETRRLEALLATPHRTADGLPVDAECWADGYGASRIDVSSPNMGPSMP